MSDMSLSDSTSSATNASGVSIPSVEDDAPALTWAFAYVNAGLYIVPVEQGSKNPGTVLGKGWPHKSIGKQTEASNEQVMKYWGSPDEAAMLGMGIHTGRSGLLVIDVDHPENVPDWMAELLADAPCQSTRVTDDANAVTKGHYFFKVPDGMRFGNGTGTMPAGFGDVRGENGFVVVAPTIHAEAEGGGLYNWVKTGEIPMLPPEFIERLPKRDKFVETDAATDDEIKKFVAETASWSEYGEDHGRDRLDSVLNKAQADVQAQKSRHDTLVNHLAWAMEESAAGIYPAYVAVVGFREWFDSLFDPQKHKFANENGEIKARKQTYGEFGSVLAWAVAKAKSKTPEELAERRERALKNPQEDDQDFFDAVQSASEAEKARTASLVVEKIAESEAAGDNPLNFLDWDAAWDEVPEEVDWLVPDLIPKGAVVALYSAAGVGKSLFSLELALKLATGGTFMNHRMEKSTVLYIDHEQNKALVIGRAKDMGFVKSDDKSRLKYSLHGEWPPLDTPEGGEVLLRAAQAKEAKLVIIDTISRTLDGEENSSDTQAGLYKHTIRRLKKEGITVLRLDHSGKDVTRGQRGSSAKTTDVDLIYALKPDGEDLILEREKNRPHLESPSTTLIHKQPTPLAHLPSMVSASNGVLDCVADLQAEGFPVGGSVRNAMKVLKDAGKGRKTTVVGQALRHMKKLADESETNDWAAQAANDK